MGESTYRKEVKAVANVRNKLRALEGRKAELDALIAFIKTHPLTASDANLIPLNNRPGLYIYDTAVIRPLRVNGKVVLRLEKRIEGWMEREEFMYHDPFDTSRLTVCEDVSKFSDRKLQKMLDALHRKLHPDEYE
jgi:hypothetical protein